MAEYDYVAGKKRIVEILRSRTEVIEIDEVPTEERFTYSNSYTSWITAIFVDIRNSLELFSNENKALVSRVMRSFTSEIIEILRKDPHLREIGIRGDCVYGIYTTHLQSGTYEVLDMAFFANTYMRMLRVLLEQFSLPLIGVGIGVSTAKDLVIKAGRKDTGISNMVWIGDSATKASKFASLGNKDGYRPIVISSLTYQNTIENLVKNSGEAARSWFRERNDESLGTFYDCDVSKIQFGNWIDGGMKE